MATSAKSLKKQQFKPQPGVQSIGWIAAGVLAVIGLAAWIYQLIAGMEVTGLGQQVVWGAYIAAFFTAAGAGAGLLALAGVNAYRPRVPRYAAPQRAGPGAGLLRGRRAPDPDGPGEPGEDLRDDHRLPA